MNSSVKTAFILLMGGTSSRMGKPIKKELVGLDGQKNALEMLIETVASQSVITTIQVVASALHHQEVQEIIKKYPYPIALCQGGATRQASVLKGLEALATIQPDYVLIHDGARPWLSLNLLTRILEAAYQYQAAIPVVALTHALKKVSSLDGVVVEHCDREQFALAQTPQGFAFMPLFQAHQQKQGFGCHDDAQLWALHYPNLPVHCIWGESINKKITYYEDLP
jgi:2-C-methyl-D-erythritol 4-phosphate cytidylyltransferase